MSDDAIALTPVLTPHPNEAVYQALNAALSATARGRWFLSEFAKRNRTSDSSKMLDAVARIEQVVADPSLAAVNADLLIVRDWAKLARLETANPQNAAERDAMHTAAQRAARIIREIATSMRAVGNDPRICNILDTQLDAIETAQHASDAPSKSAVAAFDQLIARIEELMPTPPAQPELPPVAIPSPPAEIAPQTAPADPDARLAAVTDLAVACATGDPDIAPTPAQIAEDENLLAQIAMEMASLDEEPEGIAPEVLSSSDEPDAPVVEIEAAPEAELAAAAPLPLLPQPVPEAQSGGLSLGQSVLAQGLVQPPAKPIRDPFVALKRLTQSEKVALFT